MKIIKLIRYLLAPIALVYGLIVRLRNYGYKKNILKSVAFDLPVICVGNLSVGGTGKTPMVEYLVRLLKDQYQVGILSRGYRRRSKGFVLADENSTAHTLGDEPMQFHWKYPSVALAVEADRVMAIPELLRARPETEVVLLDDAFQHRRIRPSLHILLTTYDRLYCNDYYLPCGDLRDWKGAAKRAELLVVTKCPSDLSLNEQQQIKSKLKLNTHQSLFFSKIQYLPCYDIFTKEEKDPTTVKNALLISGIANNQKVLEYLNDFDFVLTKMPFADHHYFTQREIEKIIRIYEEMPAPKTIITTEKDAVRLVLFQEVLQKREIEIWALPIEMVFLKDGEIFDERLLQELSSINTAT